MAYDAATKTIVIFGGDNRGNVLAGTWTWNGSTWTQQHPAVHPSARCCASMAYDAATGNVVLFGGSGPGGSGPGGLLGDTWTWNGSTWTQQHPAVSPPVRSGAAMAYDAATKTVVMFGGSSASGLRKTWTWNGSTWTNQTNQPVHARPHFRSGAAMAYDAATKTVVMFGGNGGNRGNFNHQTWIWNGSAWTEAAPAASPPRLGFAAMAYDAARKNVVLFGGLDNTGLLGDTWTWNGSTWTQQHPAASPPARYIAMMAYDAATSTAVLFGGRTGPRDGHLLADTWTWG